MHTVAICVVVLQGLLLNDVLGKLCDSIIELNDIRSDDAVRLHSFLKIVADKAPELLTEQSDGESEDGEAPTHFCGLLRSFRSLKNERRLLLGARFVYGSFSRY